MLFTSFRPIRSAVVPTLSKATSSCCRHHQTKSVQLNPLQFEYLSTCTYHNTANSPLTQPPMASYENSRAYVHVEEYSAGEEILSNASSEDITEIQEHVRVFSRQEPLPWSRRDPAYDRPLPSPKSVTVESTALATTQLQPSLSRTVPNSPQGRSSQFDEITRNVWDVPVVRKQEVESSPSRRKSSEHQDTTEYAPITPVRRQSSQIRSSQTAPVSFPSNQPLSLGYDEPSYGSEQISSEDAAAPEIMEPIYIPPPEEVDAPPEVLIENREEESIPSSIERPVLFQTVPEHMIAPQEVEEEVLEDKKVENPQQEPKSINLLIEIDSTAHIETSRSKPVASTAAVSPVNILPVISPAVSQSGSARSGSFVATTPWITVGDANKTENEGTGRQSSISEAAVVVTTAESNPFEILVTEAGRVTPEDSHASPTAQDADLLQVKKSSVSEVRDKSPRLDEVRALWQRAKEREVASAQQGPSSLVENSPIIANKSIGSLGSAPYQVKYDLAMRQVFDVPKKQETSALLTGKGHDEAITSPDNLEAVAKTIDWSASPLNGVRTRASFGDVQPAHIPEPLGLADDRLEEAIVVPPVTSTVFTTKGQPATFEDNRHRPGHVPEVSGAVSLDEEVIIETKTKPSFDDPITKPDHVPETRMYADEEVQVETPAYVAITIPSTAAATTKVNQSQNDELFNKYRQDWRVIRAYQVDTFFEPSLFDEDKARAEKPYWDRMIAAHKPPQAEATETLGKKLAYWEQQEQQGRLSPVGHPLPPTKKRVKDIHPAATVSGDIKHHLNSFGVAMKAVAVSEQTLGPLDDEGRDYDWAFWKESLRQGSFDAEAVYHHLAVFADSDANYTGIPIEVRPAVWMNLSGADRDHRLRLEYEVLKDKMSPHQEQLESYSAELLKEHVLTVPQTRDLIKVMTAYSIYDPESTISQDLVSCAAPLVRDLPPDEAFSLLCRLMFQYNMRAHHLPTSTEGKQTDLRVFQLETLLEQMDPKLSAHLEDKGVELVLVAETWYRGLFPGLPEETRSQLLNLYLFEQDHAITKLALCLLTENRDRLLSAGDFSTIMSILTAGEDLQTGVNAEWTCADWIAQAAKIDLDVGELIEMEEAYFKTVLHRRRQQRLDTSIIINERYHHVYHALLDLAERIKILGEEHDELAMTSDLTRQNFTIAREKNALQARRVYQLEFELDEYRWQCQQQLQEIAATKAAIKRQNNEMQR